MSELTSCNFCKLKRIRQKAKEEGKKVTLLRDAKWGMGGINIYIHPKNVKIKEFGGEENGVRANYRVSWMMEIPDNCCC